MNIPIILRGAAQTQAQFESSNNFWKEGEISLVGNKIYIAKSSGLKNDIDFVVFDANDVTGDLQSDLLDHIQDASNPHSVTKAQVGLGNVDNTSDANKPISIATQESLDSKILYVAGRPESDPTFEDSVPILLHDEDEVWFVPPNTPQGDAIVLAKPAIDPDAAAWIAAVEAEDGEALEAGILEATSTLFHGLKNTESRVAGRSNWEAMDSLGILGVPRTIDGGLVAVIGENPQNDGPFVTGDIHRGEGWEGQLTAAGNKNLNLDALLRGSATDDLGFGIYVAQAGTGGALFGAGGVENGAFHAFRRSLRISNATSIRFFPPDTGNAKVVDSRAYVGASVLDGSQVSAGTHDAEKIVRTTSVTTSSPSTQLAGRTIRIFNFTSSSNGNAANSNTDATIGLWHVGKAHDPETVKSLVDEYFATLRNILNVT